MLISLRNQIQYHNNKLKAAYVAGNQLHIKTQKAHLQRLYGLYAIAFSYYVANNKDIAADELLPLVRGNYHFI